MKVQEKYNHWLPNLITTLPIGGRVAGMVVSLFNLKIFILYREDSNYVSKRLQRHEQEHVNQMLRDRWLNFHSKYLWEYLKGLFKYKNHHKGYRNVSYEVKARKAERG